MPPPIFGVLFQPSSPKGWLPFRFLEGVTETGFDYAKVFSDPKMHQRFEAQLAALKTFPAASLSQREQALAFWINAYNFTMINTIRTKGWKDGKLSIAGCKGTGVAIEALRDLSKPVVNVGSKAFSLDEIEKGILLGKDFKKRGWKDARIHFAVNCASVGCPPTTCEAL